MMLLTALFLEGFYWLPSETVDWAYVHTVDGDHQQSTYKTFRFDWEPGFRLGAEWTLCDWENAFTYTYFRSQANDHALGPVTAGFLGARLSLLEPFSKGSASLHLNYNIFDWITACPFQVGCLTLRPLIGLKGGWINQSIHSHWRTDILLAQEILHNRFWGIGPKGGASLQFDLGNHLNLQGSFEANYLWGHWAIRDNYLDNLGTRIQVKTTDRVFGSLVLRANLGFSYEWNNFTLQLSYEIEDWWNQFQIYSNISGSENNDLILQGVNLHLGYTF